MCKMRSKTGPYEKKKKEKKYSKQVPITRQEKGQAELASRERAQKGSGSNVVA